MNSGVPERSKGIGLAGSVAGLLALIAVAIPQWVLPPPPRPATIEMHQTLKERLAAKFRNLGHKTPKVREPAGWREGLPFIAVVLALLALFLGVLSVLCGEVHVYAGVAATLGIGAIAFQMTILYAVAASVMLIMYAVLQRPGGAFALAFIGVCAFLMLSVLAALGMGFVAALLLIGAAIVILGVDMLLAGRKNMEHPHQNFRP